MRTARDNQRSRCYAWEAAASKGALERPQWATVQEAAEWLAPIWRKERGRVGRARVAAPAIESSHWGQTRALAHHDHRITLPKWARNPWVVLHEAAHRLTPSDEAHGPRFVGVLIGLVCRHLDFDATELMRLADEMGVRYHVRSIGVVPTHGPAWHVERALRDEGPMTDMDIACHLSLGCSVPINVKQVQGAAVHLIRSGRARWMRNKLHLHEHLQKPEPLPEPAPQPAKPRKPSAPRTPIGKARALAAKHGIEVEADGGDERCYWVTCPVFDEDRDDGPRDPLEGDHFCVGGDEALQAVGVYVEALARLTVEA